MTPNLTDGIIWFVVFVLSTTLHEAAHAWTALKLGDDTAYRGGQVTLDPTPHILREPIGMVVMPILSYCIGGWMLGWASAPFNPDWAIRNPRRSALMSLAGPMANLLLVLLAALLIRAGMAEHFFAAPNTIHFGQIADAITQRASAILCAKLVSVCFSLNLLLFTFNLLPLPPMDGSGLIFFFVRPHKAQELFEFLRNPRFAYIGLLIAWRCFGPIFAPIHLFAVNQLYPGLNYY
ncbi:MAG TPA: site-2 protease family protein [Chthoniobacteraceae bacterium]|nr:site-2 protease family protein [Chthoniobacteraceae bacterium]